MNYKIIIPIAVIAIIAISAFGYMYWTGQSSKTTIMLTGAGATFPYPF